MLFYTKYTCVIIELKHITILSLPVDCAYKYRVFNFFHALVPFSFDSYLLIHLCNSGKASYIQLCCFFILFINFPYFDYFYLLLLLRNRYVYLCVFLFICVIGIVILLLLLFFWCFSFFHLHFHCLLSTYVLYYEKKLSLLFFLIENDNSTRNGAGIL